MVRPEMETSFWAGHPVAKRTEKRISEIVIVAFTSIDPYHSNGFLSLNHIAHDDLNLQ